LQNECAGAKKNYCALPTLPSTLASKSKPFSLGFIAANWSATQMQEFGKPSEDAEDGTCVVAK
jgi:hypothetical protein